MTEKKQTVARQEHLEFLDRLRESGVTNMYGAGRYLVEAFDLTRADAAEVLGHWMRTFDERHPNG